MHRRRTQYNQINCDLELFQTLQLWQTKIAVEAKAALGRPLHKDHNVYKSGDQQWEQALDLQLLKGNYCFLSGVFECLVW